MCEQCSTNLLQHDLVKHRQHLSALPPRRRGYLVGQELRRRRALGLVMRYLIKGAEALAEEGDFQLYGHGPVDRWWSEVPSAR